MSDSIFDGINNAKVTNTGNWVRPGRYKAEINGVRMTKKFNGDQFVAIEMVITEVFDDGGDGQDGKALKGHKVGEEVTHLLKCSQPSFLGNFKQFASAALGCNPDEVGKAEANRITSDEQPMAGIDILLNAQTITTKAGNPFTKVTYATADTADDSQ